MWLTCQACGNGWESIARSERRFGACGRAVSVLEGRASGRDDPKGTRDASGVLGLAVVAVVLVTTGAWMLRRAKKADPLEQPPDYKAWPHWVPGGLGCVGVGVLLGL